MKILIAGLGAIGQRHVRNLRTLFGADVELLAYRTERRSPLLTDTFEIEPGDVEHRYEVRGFHRLADALAERPDAVFVCNPTSLHVPVALEAADAGCHLFIEKPLSDSLEGVDRLIDVVERGHLVALVGYQMRFHPCLRRLQRLLEEKMVGRVLAVDVLSTEHLPAWHPYEDYRRSYAARRALGGGVILTQIHDLDYVQWLFGMPRRIVAVGGQLSELDVDVEDTASILMDCGTVESPLPVHVHQNFVQKTRTRTCTVRGERGTIEVDLVASTVKVADGTGRQIESFVAPSFERNQLFLDELHHFFACLRREETPVVSLRNGLVSLRMALMARASLSSNEAVDSGLGDQGI